MIFTSTPFGRCRTLKISAHLRSPSTASCIALPRVPRLGVPWSFTGWFSETQKSRDLRTRNGKLWEVVDGWLEFHRKNLENEMRNENSREFDHVLAGLSRTLQSFWGCHPSGSPFVQASWRSILASISSSQRTGPRSSKLGASGCE